jgi:predicted nucleic acid-binding protein
MATKYKLADAPLLQNRNIFVDANVLIYCFWGTGSYYLEKKYAKTFKVLLRQQNALFIDFSVISEIINRILRIEQQKLQPTSTFKDFRNSADGKNTLSDVFLIVKHNILPKFDIIGRVFNKQDIYSLLIVDDLDFTDKSIVKLCKENSLVLLTNDGDFKNTDIDILTGNSNILNP